jgi:hypothetical protein
MLKKREFWIILMLLWLLKIWCFLFRIKLFPRRRSNVLCPFIPIFLRMTFCFQGRAFQDWLDTSKDACHSKWFLNSSLPCYKRTWSILPFCQWFLQEVGHLLLYRLPNSLNIYLKTVATCAEFIKDTLSDFRVSSWHNNIRLFNSSFLFGWHSN